MQLKPLILSLSLLFVLPAFTFAQQDEWKEEQNKDGVLVLSRKVDGEKYRQAKATMVVDASAEDAFEMLVDGSKHYIWMHKVVKSEMLDRGEGRIVVYYQAEAPWPVTDRDAVLEWNFRSENGVFYSDAKIKKGVKPEQDGFVRIPKQRSNYTIEPLAENQCRVTYFTLSDPGGSVPGWAANMAISEGPFNTFSNLKRELEKP